MKRSIVVPSGCREWTLSRFPNGYGGLTYQRHSYYAHRFAWEIYNGAIPPKMMVLHHCDNRACVEISHLWLGTHADNMLDMAIKGRAHFGYKLSLAQVDAIRLHLSLGDAPKAIAADLEIVATTIYDIRDGRTWARTGVPLPRRPKAEYQIKGTDLWWKAKLAEDDVRQIRDLAASGTTIRELESRYGVSYQTVWCVVHRKTWKHIA